jgi:flagellar protein FliO/FliZ
LVSLIPLAAAQSGDGGGSADRAAPSPDSAPVDERELTFGEEEEAEEGAQPVNIDSFGVWDFVRMVVVLGIVIAAIYLVFYLLKRASGGRLENSPMIRVLGSHGLPGNKALHLVEVGRQVFLIGVGDDAISFISEISDQESLDELRLKTSTSTGDTRGSFADMLSGFFHGATGGGSDGGTPTENGGGRKAEDAGRSSGPASFFESQKERLRKLR